MSFSRIISSRNLQNSFWNITEVLLTPFVFFVSIPIFLRQLGTQDYGIWMFVNSVIVIMQIFNLGLNFSTYKHVSVSLPKGENKKIKQTLDTNLSLTFIIFLFCLVVCGILCFGIKNFGWFTEGIDNVTTLIYCLFIGMGILFAKLTEQILYNVYRAFEDFKYVTILTIAIKVFTVIGNILLAMLTQNIVYIFCFTLFMIVLGVFINYKLLHRFIPFYTYQWSLNKVFIKNEISYSLFIWLQSIAVIIAYQGDRLLVSYGFGLSTLSFYAIVATLFNHIHMAFGAILAWLFPQIAKNKDNKEIVYKAYLNARNILISISVVLLGIFCLLSELIFSLWLGEINYLEIRDYIKWFSVFEFFFIFNIAPHFFLNAAGHEKFSLKMVAIYTGLNIAGMLIGVLFFNNPQAIVIGLALSILIGMIIFQWKIDKKFSDLPNREFRTFILFIPSIIGSGTAYFDNYYLKGILFILSLISIYLIFIKFYKTNFKTLIQ
ncbi:MAG: oligosaccharide flippase family protein [Flavobacteriales bacterium]